MAFRHDITFKGITVPNAYIRVVEFATRRARMYDAEGNPRPVWLVRGRLMAFANKTAANDEPVLLPGRMATEAHPNTLKEIKVEFVWDRQAQPNIINAIEDQALLLPELAGATLEQD